jgi:hypothetical protein
VECRCGPQQDARQIATEFQIERPHLARLIAYARSESIEQLYGSVLAENGTMLRMCGEFGFSIAPQPGDAAVRRVVLRLA